VDYLIKEKSFDGTFFYLIPLLKSFLEGTFVKASKPSFEMGGSFEGCTIHPIVYQYSPIFVYG
jgi:hypothetical protein